MKVGQLVAASCLTVVMGCAGTAGVPAAPKVGTARAATVAPCGTLAVSSTSYTHVIWVWMENHSYSSIIGSSQAPYVNALARSCGLATNYHNVTHPSLPNYIAATSGLSLQKIQRFTSDCSPSSQCSTTAPSVFGQGKSWKAYEESMPKNCDSSGAGEYAVRHNPPAYYTTLKGCTTFDVPLTQLKTDLDYDTLPAFSFVTPNLIDDMHDGTVAEGDAWLSKNLNKIFKSSVFRTGKVVVFVTWDEGEGGSSNDCATNTTDVGCHIATIVASPSTAVGTRSSTLFNHYSLLMTTEELLGLPLLGSASTATSMKSAFNL